ncbi:MAG: peptidoglycan-binding domain-containing protein [Candidatus Acidiferrales bacterium]
MSKRTWLFIFGAVLLVSAASVVSGADHPGAAQASSTTAKKKKVSSKSKRKPKVKGQTVPTPDRIREIQTALQKDGSYAGEPTGKWDAATTDAMRKYQDKIGVSPTGKIDAVSLNKLGLGSDTAGKGAPVPAASTSASPADPPQAK